MAKENLTKSANIDTHAREVDFVTRFANNWDALRDILGVTRMIRKTPGTVLKSKYAVVTLENGNVAEGAEIPYSQAQVKTKDYAPINVEKFAKGVSIEAINEHGYDDAVGLTDDQFLYELQNDVMGRFYAFINTGTLTSAKPTFQAALAEAQGQVRNKWKAMHKGITDVVGFCNILDAYDYLGAANITVQTNFGMNYIENFIGYSRLFLCSDEEVARGKVIATPVENIIDYYVSPDDSDFARAGLAYTTDGETNLIGFHVQGDYKTAVSESYALMGMTLMAEYLDGIANVDIDDSFLTDLTVAADADDKTYPWTDKTPSDFQSDVAVVGGKVTGTLKFIEGGLSPAGPLAGDGYFLALKYSNFASGLTYANVKMGLVPSASGMALQTLDSDCDSVSKITDKENQKIKVVQSDGSGHTNVQWFSLKDLVLEEPEGV